jgi:hypothetical protein
MVRSARTRGRTGRSGYEMRTLSYRTYVIALLVSVALLAGATAARADQTVGAATDGQPAATQPIAGTAVGGSSAQPSQQAAASGSLGDQTIPSSPPQPSSGNGGSSESTDSAAPGADPNAGATATAGQPDTTPPEAGNSPVTNQETPAPGLGENGSANGGPSTGDAQPSTGDTQPDAARSNSATQAIWQVQSLGCLSHCRGTTQSQTAQQQNTTAEVAPAIPQAGTGSPTGAGPDTSDRTVNSPTSSTNVTQIQLGCISHCFGSTTTTTTAGDSERPQQAIDQLLSSPAPPALPGQEPISAPEQNAVDQSAYQSQDGQGLVPIQSQTALQTNTTVQASGPFSSLAGLLLPSDPSSSTSDSSFSSLSDPSSTADSSPGGSSSPIGQQALDALLSPVIQVVNQVEQGIWQLQIGCLVFCSQTNQSQQAEQSDTTIWVMPSPVGTMSGTPANLTSSTYQLIWQLQIGCIFWCYDAVETQEAITSTSVFTWGPPPPQQPPGTPTPAPSGSPALGTNGPPTGAGTQQVPPAATAVGPPAIDAPAAPSGEIATAPPGRFVSPPVHFGKPRPATLVASQQVIGLTRLSPAVPAAPSPHSASPEPDLPLTPAASSAGHTSTISEPMGDATSTLRRHSRQPLDPKGASSAHPPTNPVLGGAPQPADDTAVVLGLIATMGLLAGGRAVWQRARRRDVDLG